MKNVIGPGGVRYPVTPDIERFLRSMDRDALQSLVLEMAGYSPEAMRSLQLRATPEDEPTASELLVTVDGALAGVDLDYHDPFYEDVDDGAQGVEEVVDELERHLDGGAHPVVRRVLQHLLTRLGDLARDADNADALLGVAERASTLFGRTVAGHPDPVGLARWVVGFRVEYGGWPSLTLDAVAHAFDEPAWVAYRASVAALGGGEPSADPYRSETDRMLLELADHDGDVDRAVALLSGGDHPYYREIFRRLRDAGRPADILAWLDQAVTQGCVDVAWRAGPTIVPVEDAVDAYLDGGRPDAALAIARTLFDRDLSVDALRFAEPRRGTVRTRGRTTHVGIRSGHPAGTQQRRRPPHQAPPRRRERHARVGGSGRLRRRAHVARTGGRLRRRLPAPGGPPVPDSGAGVPHHT